MIIIRSIEAHRLEKKLFQWAKIHEIAGLERVHKISISYMNISV